MYFKHGHTCIVVGSRTPEYIAWQAMKRRCSPTWYKRYLYFDRGIRVSDKWVSDFAAFFAHLGPKPSKSHQLDRIDNERGYEPGNVRWADIYTQRRNQRTRGPRKPRSRDYRLITADNPLGLRTLKTQGGLFHETHAEAAG